MQSQTATPMTEPSVDASTVAPESQWVGELQSSVSQVIVGQENLLRSLLIGLLTGGHILLEGVPGLAKSLAVSSLASAVRASFARIQFTPDLLPSDVLGTEVYNAKEGSFQARKGPIFANFVLADEINRAPAKVQSALLEAMQERQVSIGGESFPLPRPFLVLATQNPLEHEGTYALPEAQLDRFALKVIVDYPTPAEELEIVERMARTGPTPTVPAIVDPERILAAREVVDRVRMDPRLTEYIVSIVHATREPAHFGLEPLENLIRYGASPRATITLVMASRANAFLEGRDFVSPSDIKRVAPEILRHRVVPTYEAEAEGRTSDDLVSRILETVPVP